MRPRFLIATAFASIVLYFTTLAAASPTRAAQAPGDTTSAHPDSTAGSRRVRLYLDCDEFTCDFDFLRRQIPWVDWVRNRQDADVYVLLATRTTGSGGSEGQFTFLRPHGGPTDTLRVFVGPNASDDEVRNVIARTLEAGLARDLVGTPDGDRLRVVVDAPEGQPKSPPPPSKDPWNAWVFRARVNGYFNGEQSYNSLNTYSSLAAARVTEASKLDVRANQSYSESRYRFEGGGRFTSISRSWSGSTHAVKSLAPRWSAGANAFVSSSTYSNLDLSVGGGPVIEFDVYPYAESARRALTIAYQLGVRHANYEEETLYGKTRETLFNHELVAGVGFKQPWGTIGLTLNASEYLHDASKYSLSASGNANLNLWKGFSLNVSGYATRVRDQLSLRRGSASDSQVIARQRQLATSYQYFVSVGASYTFGSVFNNVVNPRLENVFGGF